MSEQSDQRSGPLEGELERFTYLAPDGGYAIGIVRSSDGNTRTAVGPIGHLHPGTWLRLEGRWERHPRFGDRFRVRRYLTENPKTLVGLERYLASGTIKGLGAELARRTVEKFGLDTLRILDEEPERLKEVTGIGERRCEEIISHWERDKADRAVTILLRGHDIGASVIQRILDLYGEQAMEIISRDPYQMIGEIPGVAFRTADAVGAAAGVPPEHPTRAEAATRWLLSQASGEGHCCLPLKTLEARGRQVRLRPDQVRLAVERLVLEGALTRYVIPSGEQLIYDAAVDRAEQRVARSLAERARGNPADEAEVLAAEARAGLELDPEQREAVRLALGHGVAVITGGPGTGKTTIVKVLMAAARLRRERWSLAAPTGRAARRLAESCGQDGKTIHRLLEYAPQSHSFLRDASAPLEARGVLIDEASMLDLRLLDALLQALVIDSRLVLVGDADQLPSVGAGRVLRDVIASGKIPVARLNRVYRQAGGSGIVRNAHRILRGEPPISAEREAAPPETREPAPALRRDFFVVTRRDPRHARDTILEIVGRRMQAQGFDPIRDVQVLTPVHRGPMGSQALNAALQDMLNPDGEELKRGKRRLRVGDRVIQVRNDYESDIFNGDTGLVTAVKGGGLEVEFDGRPVALVGDQLDRVELAYAISIHKSQGSEYPAVIIALHDGHHLMLRRSLIYTAVTRARRFCCLVGSARAIETAAAKGGGDARWTRLAERLAAEGA